MIYKEAANWIKSAKFVIFSSGAGMGVDSGLPDFRGNNGFWNTYPPYTNKFTFYECANPGFLDRHPELFWGFYGTRLIMYRQKTPHEGFEILYNIATKKKDYFVFTSNVDGHFNRFFKDKVYEVHGTIHKLQCSQCLTITQNTFLPKINYEKMSCQNYDECICKKCKNILRPNILMFDDYQWNSQNSAKQQKEFNRFINNISEQQIVLVQIGAGNTISTIRRMNESILYRFKNSKLIRINPQPENLQIKNRFLHINNGALDSLKCIKSIIQSI